jgi:hypothetical protein
MKPHSFIYLFLALALKLNGQCEQSFKTAETNLGQNFIVDPRHAQAIVSNGDSLTFQATWLASNTYRVATSSSEKQPVRFILFDQNNTPIFDSSEFNYPVKWDFFVEESMIIRCVVHTVIDISEPYCLTTLTGFKK